MQHFAFARNSSNPVGPELWARLQWDCDLWIIAYGSRMAEPNFPFCEAAPALLGDSDPCLGIAYRVPAVDVPAALGELSKGDRRHRSCELQEIEADTPSGRVTGYVLGRPSHDVGQRKAA
jgi:cation transport regulator ChaC